MLGVVFTGPTISASEVRELWPEVDVQPPAARGDVLRAVRRDVTTIVLIDGYFEHRLSVWHKEILWALTRGVRVYGAASMGALRAAECAAFGMIPVGKIARQFLDGTLERDDEVAVAHASAEHGYRTASEAAVNIRETLTGEALDRELARFYPERRCRGAFDQKLADAREAIALARAEFGGPPEPLTWGIERADSLARLFEETPR